MLNNKEKDQSRWLCRIPILAWTIVYSITCVLGALMVSLDYRPFVALFQYFSGIHLELPTEPQVWMVFYTLLLVVPLLMWAGYLTGWYLGDAFIKLGYQDKSSTYSLEWVWAVATFGLSFGVAVFSLIRCGAFEQLSAWTQYELWIQVRWQLFSKLSFFEFVNLYIFMPLAAGWLMIGVGNARSKRFVAWSAVMVVIIISLLLYQKKSLIVSLILVSGVIGLWRFRLGYVPKRPGLLLGAGIVSVGLTYFVLVVLPVYKQAEQTVTQAEQTVTQAEQTVTQAEQTVTQAEQTVTQAEQTEKEIKEEWMSKLYYEFGGFENRREAVLLYALMAPLTRTSVSTIYYSYVFPAEHSFYGLDLGQDVFGFGEMPDDNKVVWNRMNPDFGGGTAAAPFHFVLYSQVGILGTLAGSFLVGIGLGWSWFVVLKRVRSPVISSMAGSLIILFAIYLAIDSARNSLIVSYGVGWGAVFLVWVWVTERVVGKQARKKISISIVERQADTT